ncbi:MAG: hypothetical protein NT155_03120 [Candidatus Staskawiczbacteria bacterium]|nr:hypothetical protein [Candidatus Staskawiczbacteria bacterium]
MKYATQKIKTESGQCSICSAKFEVWLDNSKLDDERKEKIGEKLLSYCPVCSRSSEK